MNVILLGPPGAGKGTLAHLVKQSTSMAHLSTGDILREEMKNETDLGKEAKNFVESGQLVPDELVTKLIAHRVTSNGQDSDGFMFDGFPRTTGQAEDLTGILEGIKKPLDYALYMESTLPVIIQRLSGRRVCRKCGHVYHIKNRPPKKEGICDQCDGELYQRADDNEETIRKRMDVYLQNTKPIIEYYERQGMLRKLDGDKEAEDLLNELMKLFDADGKLNNH